MSLDEARGGNALHGAVFDVEDQGLDLVHDSVQFFLGFLSSLALFKELLVGLVNVLLFKMELDVIKDVGGFFVGPLVLGAKIRG